VPANSSKQAAADALKSLELILEENGNSISAMIIEPLVQGAGGMHMYHADYLVGARMLTKKYGIHLILDEIMTGFGRTGTMFACEQASISPDFMTLSKGLTGGYLALSVVMTTDEIYGAFYCDYNEHKAFLHSHSYTGNPLACSAALATLELFEQSNILEENREKSLHIDAKLEKFKLLANVKEVRVLGMIAAVELQGYKAEERIGLKIYEFALARGVLLRPLGHVIYFMPPYIITIKEIDKVLDVMYDAIKTI
jgi:adenosylmethionine-8-amino-7-oxononanoate aminotransferase